MAHMSDEQPFPNTYDYHKLEHIFKPVTNYSIIFALRAFPFEIESTSKKKTKSPFVPLGCTV